MLPCFVFFVFKLRIVMCTLCPRSQRFRLSLHFGYSSSSATSAPETTLYAVKSALRNSGAFSGHRPRLFAQISPNLKRFFMPGHIANRKFAKPRIPSRARRRSSGNWLQSITPHPHPAIRFFHAAVGVSHCATRPSQKIPDFRGLRAIIHACPPRSTSRIVVCEPAPHPFQNAITRPPATIRAPPA